MGNTEPNCAFTAKPLLVYVAPLRTRKAAVKATMRHRERQTRVALNLTSVDKC